MSKPYCTCDELDSGLCGFCQDLDGLGYKSLQELDAALDYEDHSNAVEYLEDEEFDDDNLQ